jgi:hypothetical protein
VHGYSPDENCNIDVKVRSPQDTWKPDKFKQQDLWILDEKRNKGKDRLKRDIIK